MDSATAEAADRLVRFQAAVHRKLVSTRTGIESRANRNIAISGDRNRTHVHRKEQSIFPSPTILFQEVIRIAYVERIEQLLNLCSICSREVDIACVLTMMGMNRVATAKRTDHRA